jgi:hypothetical protein
MPVAVRATSATAAILVLSDILKTPSCWRGLSGRYAQLVEVSSIPVRNSFGFSSVLRGREGLKG